MKYTGTVTELDSSMSLTEFGFDLTRVIVSKDEIAMEWQEEDRYGLLLKLIDPEMQLYTGECTSRDNPFIKGYYTAYRWNLANKGILLLATWKYAGLAGVCMFDLEKE